ncbi:hypothetical protein EJ06DRAFT_508003 [Trichodelitschia bisporula]|uniref:CBM20 domain-containing protein n=1 Tax=Trichodelitschia bisporula TaxID=703511 RepID=A0A6G1I0P1_9PEZI|nr:hypothetical protein EJ06DRAFT_508003 [Trichodelitschia bisporula]
MAAVQIPFTIRTTPHVQTVHLLGSWDNYQGQLPMSRDASGPLGSWMGTFRFQSGTLAPGQRYWYYYIMDGYHVSHDPQQQHTVEPTTGRSLNILDVPAGASARTSKRHSRRISVDVAKGRSLSPSQIQSPKPYNPVQTAAITGADYAAVDRLANHLRAATLEENDEDSSDDESDVSSDVPSLTSASSRSSNSSSPSSVSSRSSCCTCERYGITRGGSRVKLDCNGARCGYSDDSSSCDSDSDSGAYYERTTRRQGIVIRS